MSDITAVRQKRIADCFNRLLKQVKKAAPDEEMPLLIIVTYWEDTGAAYTACNGEDPEELKRLLLSCLKQIDNLEPPPTHH